MIAAFIGWLSRAATPEEHHWRQFTEVETNSDRIDTRFLLKIKRCEIRSGQVTGTRPATLPGKGDFTNTRLILIWLSSEPTMCE